MFIHYVERSPATSTLTCSWHIFEWNCFNSVGFFYCSTGYLSVRPSVYVCVYLSICQSVHLFVCVSVSVRLSVCLFVFRSVSIFVYLSAYLCVCPSVYVPVWLSIFMSMCLFVCLSLWLSIYLRVVVPAVFMLVSLCVCVFFILIGPHFCGERERVS